MVKVQLRAQGPIIKCAHAKYDAAMSVIALFEPQFRADEFEMFYGARLVEINDREGPAFMVLYLPLEIPFIYFEEDKNGKIF